MPIYGNQRQFKDFEKIGTTLGHIVIHGDSGVNVSVINGRPTWVFKFKLTTANLSLRICKSKGGCRAVNYLGDKSVGWPKDLSGGLEFLNQTGGLVKIQSMAIVDPLGEGNPVKPNTILLSSGAHYTWALGESSKGGGT